MSLIKEIIADFKKLPEQVIGYTQHFKRSSTQNNLWPNKTLYINTIDHTNELPKEVIDKEVIDKEVDSLMEFSQKQYERKKRQTDYEKFKSCILQKVIIRFNSKEFDIHIKEAYKKYKEGSQVDIIFSATVTVGNKEDNHLME